MRGTTWLGGVVCIVLLSTPSVARGQAAGTATGGALWGTVTDETRAVLPGVTVTVEGAALMGSQVAVTNEQGIYRFPSLPPGEFKLTFALEGFNTLVREGIHLTLAFTATVNAELKVGTAEQSVEVIGGSPVLDTVNTRLQTSFNREVLESTLTGRDVRALFSFVPGIQMTTHEVGGGGIGGAPWRSYGTTRQNVPVVEGVVSLESDGASGFSWDYGSFDEVNFGTAGQGAEMANPGVRWAIISKSGGNEFHGDFYADYENSALQTTNIDAQQIAKGVMPGTNRIHRIYDLNFSAGGAIKNDKIWWFGSVRRRQGETRSVNYTPEPLVTIWPMYTGKLTYQLPANNRIIGYMMFTRHHYTNRLLSFQLGSNAFYAKPEYTWPQDNPAWIGKIEWNRSFGSRVFIEARVGRWGIHTTAHKRTDEPRREDLSTREVTGGARDWEVYHYRPQTTGAISYYKDGWAGSHNFKLGWEIQKDQERQKWHEAFPGNLVHIFRDGVATEVFQLLAPLNSVNRLYWSGIYLTDTWNLGRLSVNAGARFDRYRSAYPDQSRPANRFAEAIDIPGNDNLVTWNVLAPRIGVVWDITGDNRNALKTSYGRYRFNPSRIVASTVNPNNSPQWRRYTWTDLNGDRVWQSGEEGRLLETRGGVATGQVDPNMKNSYTDEVTLWFERELGNQFAARTGFVYKREAQLFQTVNVLTPPEAFNIPVTAIDPGPDGQVGTTDDGVFTLFNLQPTLIGRTLNLLTNAPNYTNTYRTWEIAAQRRFSARWSMNASFDITWRNDFQAIPYTLNDPPQSRMLPIRMVKVMGSYEPGWGLRINPLVRFQSGDPFGRVVNVRLNYGNQAVLAEPTGTRRTDDVLIVDLRAERAFKLHRGTKLNLFLDAFNIFNSNAEVQLVPTTGSTFLRPLSILSPRIFRVGSNVSW